MRRLVRYVIVRVVAFPLVLVALHYLAPDLLEVLLPTATLNSEQQVPRLGAPKAAHRSHHKNSARPRKTSSCPYLVEEGQR